LIKRILIPSVCPVQYPSLTEVNGFFIDDIDHVQS
jgi:hypothetical protein